MTYKEIVKIARARGVRVLYPEYSIDIGEPLLERRFLTISDNASGAREAKEGIKFLEGKKGTFRIIKSLDACDVAKLAGVRGRIDLFLDPSVEMVPVFEAPNGYKGKTYPVLIFRISKRG
jgi:hypothetical protein